MKKFILLLLTTYSLMANTLPKPIETTIKSIYSERVQLASTIPQGVSGIVVHDYGNGLSAITHSLVTTKDGFATLLPYKAILHPNIPSVKTEAKVNDRVILGGFYDNALVIAPDEKSYSKITKTFKKTWIHPDAYAVALMKDEEYAISLDSLKRFSEANQIGLVLIAYKNSLLVLDPISKKFISKQPFQSTAQQPMRPFFSHFEQMDVSTFGWSDIELKDYYIAIDELNKQ